MRRIFEYVVISLLWRTYSKTSCPADCSKRRSWSKTTSSPPRYWYVLWTSRIFILRFGFANRAVDLLAAPPSESHSSTRRSEFPWKRRSLIRSAEDHSTGTFLRGDLASH